MNLDAAIVRTLIEMGALLWAVFIVAASAKNVGKEIEAVRKELTKMREDIAYNERTLRDAIMDHAQRISKIEGRG